MRRQLSGILALALLLSTPAIGVAAEEDLIALWMTPDGTLEIKDGGAFAGKPKDMDGFAGTWEINADGRLVLTRDDGKTAECTFTVTDQKLTLEDCPASGEYAKSQ
jgi:uncharacterized protein (DUF2147 family)